MRYLEITGGIPLHGAIDIQGSKNAVLPVLAACLLGEGACVIENCPAIGDVEDLLTIMEELGCQVQKWGHRVAIDPKNMKKYKIMGTEAARIRCSVLFLGALLGKMGKVILPMPGGCAIGKRPIDLHVEALECLGAEFSICEAPGAAEAQKADESENSWQDFSDRTAESGKSPEKIPASQITAAARQLRGTRIHLRIPSVGATENIILAAVLAEGETLIEHAAMEPEIDELCAFLNLRGARIRRLQDGGIRIQGVKELRPVIYRMRADRIVAGTYLLAAAATGGTVRIRNFPWSQLDALLEVLEKMGAVFRKEGQELYLEEGGVGRPVSYLETKPYPGFPTDLQSQLMAVLCRVPGRSCICERIFENRYATADWLNRMGAVIRTEGRCARICGVDVLNPAVLEAPDLRGGAALVIAALQTPGRTIIKNVEYIERGYEDISRDLRSLGARIELKKDIP